MLVQVPVKYLVCSRIWSFGAVQTLEHLTRGLSTTPMQSVLPLPKHACCLRPQRTSVRPQPVALLHSSVHAGRLYSTHAVQRLMPFGKLDGACGLSTRQTWYILCLYPLLFFLWQASIAA
jgi:hypothetical protein